MNHQMESQPPPGYNPNASLLQGGTDATIVPVQGGGGLQAPPPDYNASASLLNGGNSAVIQPMRGGVTVRFAKDEQDVATFEKSKPVINVSSRRLYKNYTIEQFSFTERSPLTDIDDREIRRKRYESYVKSQRLNELVNTEKGQMAFDSKRPIYDRCKNPNPQQLIPRVVKLIDSGEPHIFIVPPLQGSKEAFEKAKGHIEKLNASDYVIFLAPIFEKTVTPSSLATSSQIFDEILQLKEKKPGKVWFLNDYSEDALKMGCGVSNLYYSAKTPKDKGRIIPTTYEPDIIVFLRQKIVFHSSDIPEVMDTVLEAYKKNPRYPTLFSLKVSGRTDLDGYFRFVSTKGLPTKFPTKKDVKCPEDADCLNMEGGWLIEHLNNPFVLADDTYYIARRNPKKEPYNMKPFDALRVPPVDAEVKEEEEEEEVEKEEEAEAEEKAEEEEEETPSLKTAKPVKKSFKAAEDSVKEETEALELDRESFALRKPTDPVKADWKAAKFTESEADFLNMLQLSPEILESVYKDSWKSEVSRFLANMAVSSCFKDQQLLLQSECDASRQFLKKVFFKKYSNTLDELYTQWGSKTPKEDSKDVLAKLMQTMETISVLSANTNVAGKIDMVNIEEKDFRGDPEGRFVKMNVDIDRDPPTYFANVVEKANNGQKSYKRIYGEPKNIIRTYKNIVKKNKAKNNTKKNKPSQNEGSQNEAPKNEAPKNEAPKNEAPKNEGSQTEAPKNEAPKNEAPEGSQTEAPKNEAPEGSQTVATKNNKKNNTTQNVHNIKPKISNENAARLEAFLKENQDGGRRRTRRNRKK
jgi:hypothetical protein